MKKDIESRINGAVSSMIPEDMWNKVQDKCSKEERQIIMKTKNTSKRTMILRYASIAVAACLLIAVGVVGGKAFFNKDKTPEIVTVIDIDVNPSIEISADKNDKVVKVEAVNADAVKILDGMKLENVDLNVALNAIIGSMAKNGLLDDGKILVTVLNDDAQKAQEIRNSVVSDINSSLKTNKADAEVINQTAGKDSEAEKFASENKISVGKAIFILNLCAKDNTLDAKALSKMSLREIALLVKEKNIDIRDIVNYDADDSIFENIEDKVEDDNLVSKIKITAAQAKETALSHAGVKLSDAAFIKVKVDDENGKPYYDIEFRAAGVEYEYEIDAETGDVIKAENDKPVANAPSKPENTKYITVEEAKQKALNHAKVSGKVRFVKAEFDYDDGVALYEIEFILDGKEYEYEISATDGKVIDFEIERDDDDKPQQGGSNDTPKYITAEEAKQKALSHAKVTNAQFVKAELDTENGRAVYEVEFTANGIEYEYEIDAVSGSVLRYESERDDDKPQQGGSNDTSKYITAEEAKQKALSHAKVTNAQFVKAELDTDDGRAVYEVEFTANGIEYEYEIDAVSGSVLRYESERDD